MNISNNITRCCSNHANKSVDNNNTNYFKNKNKDNDWNEKYKFYNIKSLTVPNALLDQIKNNCTKNEKDLLINYYDSCIFLLKYKENFKKANEIIKNIISKINLKKNQPSLNQEWLDEIANLTLKMRSYLIVAENNLKLAHEKHVESVQLAIELLSKY